MTRLRPFFSYFGSKYRLAPLYPEPKHSVIIEPFAGSAGYSLCYPDKAVILYDGYAPLVELWNYLIKVKESEILSLPIENFNKDFAVSSLNVAEEVKTLIGFWLTESQTYASNYPLSKTRGGSKSWNNRKKTLIASQLRFIRHWKAKLSLYQDVPNDVGTWFIDPPYQGAGKRYKVNGIDFSELGLWCRERKGQKIVCEQNQADWLPFKHLVDVNNGNKEYKEVIWHEEST